MGPDETRAAAWAAHRLPGGPQRRNPTADQGLAVRPEEARLRAPTCSELPDLPKGQPSEDRLPGVRCLSADRPHRITRCPERRIWIANLASSSRSCGSRYPRVAVTWVIIPYFPTSCRPVVMLGDRMFLLGSYILVALVALIWMALDTDATSAFEIFRRHLHRTARAMQMYSDWAFHSLRRCVFLLTLVALSLLVTFLMLAQNPFDLGQSARNAMFASTLIGSLAMIPLPYLSAHLRLLRHLYSKAADLSELVSIVTSETEVPHHLEPAEYDTSDRWTAWHPKEDQWKADRYWIGIVPVAYLRQGTELSLIVPVDWEHFLAWKIPAGSAVPGCDLPFKGPGETAFTVKTVHRVIGRQGWSVVRADMKI
jgi:hypothetical protein